MALAAIRPITLAVHALGGQGGGVLVDWIVNLAEEAGWLAQSTSVAGVAQRTGATIYYLELLPPQAPRTDGRAPVLAQMPVPGEVDIVIAAELMEAGRAVQRGLVTPERTLVIASTHRTYSVQEKSIPGNGVADAAAVVDAVRACARVLICEDMQALAVRHGSVISASLFGALAGSGALPFPVEAFEATVRRAGVGVEPSLRALRAGALAAQTPQPAPRQAPDATDSMETAARPLPQHAQGPAVQPLLDRIRSQFAEPIWPMLGEGLQRTLEYQDVDYGKEYLDRMAVLHAADQAAGGAAHGYLLTIEAARWVAVAMAYDDVMRVAELKTRATRFARVRREVGAAAQDVVETVEYFHPRLEELCGMLPRALGLRLERSPALQLWLGRKVDRSRRLRPGTVLGHMQLRALAGLRRWRRGNLRHGREMAHLQAWLDQVQRALAQDYGFAVAVLRCRRLVKGYSDTHARGSSRFDRLMQACEQLQGRGDAAIQLDALRDAALKDASGAAFDMQLKRL